MVLGLVRVAVLEPEKLLQHQVPGEETRRALCLGYVGAMVLGVAPLLVDVQMISLIWALIVTVRGTGVAHVQVGVYVVLEVIEIK